MRYDLTPDKIKKAKTTIKKIEKEIKKWEAVKKTAEEDLERFPNKYAPGIYKRLKHAQDRVKEYTDKKEIFQQAIERGYVEI